MSPKPHSIRTRTPAKTAFLEIGVEEIPSDVLPGMLHQISESAKRRLTEADLAYKEIFVYGTPRRLILVISDLASRQPDRIEKHFGPPKTVAFDAEGRPTAAAMGFARVQGVPLSALMVCTAPKGEYLAVQKTCPGQTAIAILSSLFPGILSDLVFVKSMRWSTESGLFIRPIRWGVALYGKEIVPFSYAGVVSGRHTEGHHTLSPTPFRISDFAQYRTQIRKRHVLIDPQERHDRIMSQLSQQTRAIGGVLAMDDALVSQAAYTTEYPTAVVGKFDPEFLRLPTEIIITVMKEHQGYFPIHTPSGPLLPNFITIVNLPRLKNTTIVEGNERVLRARLTDACFYYEDDIKRALETRRPLLKEVIFHEKLGTLWDKTERLVHLCKSLAQGRSDTAMLLRAARLCKCDLPTRMAREFPSLQGTLAGLYGRHDGEPPEVCQAIAEHPLPRFAKDALPATDLGQWLAIIDKIDTIVGCFCAGLIPSGSEDPYALRRHGTGVIQLLAQPALQGIPLSHMIAVAIDAYRIPQKPQNVRDAIHGFMKGRLISWLESQGFRPDFIQAVLVASPLDEHREKEGPVINDPYNALQRLSALRHLSDTPCFTLLLTCIRRATRILPAHFYGTIDASLYREAEERHLDREVSRLEREVTLLCQQRDYIGAFTALASLAEPLDAFFNHVLVVDPDEKIRQNRLALLGRVRDLFAPLADFSKMEQKT